MKELLNEISYEYAEHVEDFLDNEGGYSHLPFGDLFKGEARVVIPFGKRRRDITIQIRRVDECEHRKRRAWAEIRCVLCDRLLHSGLVRGPGSWALEVVGRPAIVDTDRI